jgi:hypothetical protein
LIGSILDNDIFGVILQFPGEISEQKCLQQVFVNESLKQVYVSYKEDSVLDIDAVLQEFSQDVLIELENLCVGISHFCQTDAQILDAVFNQQVRLQIFAHYYLF